MHEKWKAIWARLFVGPHGWSRRDKVLEYVVHRIDDGAHVREVVQEEYVRRMATQSEIERILADPRIIEGARERMRRELRFEDLTSRKKSRANRPEATTEFGRKTARTVGDRLPAPLISVKKHRRKGSLQDGRADVSPG